jgi:hypothetical protein
VSSVALAQESSFNNLSGKELAETYGVDANFHIFLDRPEWLLPEVGGIYTFVKYLVMSTIPNRLQFPCSPKRIATFLNSALYQSIRNQLEKQRPATDEDAERVIKIIVSTMPLQQNISPQVLAEVFMEIIREDKPSKLALHFARLSIRNGRTFVPSPKEFRDTLLQTIKSLKVLNEAVVSLPDELNRAA